MRLLWQKITKTSHKRELLILSLALLLIIPFNQGIANRVNFLLYGAVIILVSLLVLLDRKQKLLLQNQFLIASVVVLIAWIFASTLWSYNKYSALSTAYTYGLGAIVFIVLLGLFKYQYLRRSWLWAYLSISALSGLVGVWAITQNVIERVQFGAILANSAAGFLLPAIIMLLYGRSQLKPRSPLLKLCLVGLGLCIAIGFILTFSRGALLCFMIATLVFVSFRYHRQLVLIYSFVTFLTFGFVLAKVNHWQISQNNQSYLTQNVFRSTTETLHDRKIYAESALSLFKQHPLVGAGAGSYRIVGIINQPEVYMLSTNAHASFLQFLSEFGLIGGLLLALVVSQIGYKFWRGLHNSDSQAYIAAALALTIHFAIDIDLIYPPLIFLLVSITALALGSTETETSNA